MSSVHSVVVWEWQSNGQWLPHTPSVTRTLERAHAKKLTRVVLADADPALKGYYVNLLTLMQSVDTPEGGVIECGVRRSCYSVQSVVGRGWRWEWARFIPPPGAGELNYEPLPLDIQCHLEESWLAGLEAVCAGEWTVSLACMTARRGSAVRLLRRAAHPPYPLTLTHPPAVHHRHDVRKSRIPQQHTGSSAYSAESAPPCMVSTAHSASHSTAHSATLSAASTRSASPKDRKPGIARQILHNLNIFSNNNKSLSSHTEKQKEVKEDSQHTDVECHSTRSDSGRRHSVDTVSTYLSHESKESLQQAAVGELLNCSGSSDDVFESSNLTQQIEFLDDQIDESWWRTVSTWTSSAAPRGACALCDVTPRDVTAGRALALSRCPHSLHLNCLTQHLLTLTQRRESLYMECGLCGQVYGYEGPMSGPISPVPGPTGPVCSGSQPRGSMSWRVQQVSLPQFEHCPTSILVTYNFQSGTQGPSHPSPGAPYYAVGFPRYSLLPDTELGRQVLLSLRVCWERGLLFVLCVSRTTGREHVVGWSTSPPPPAHRTHYLCPAAPRALLADLLQRLHGIMHRPL